MVVRVSGSSSITLARNFLALVLIMASSATIRGAVATIGSLLSNVRVGYWSYLSFIAEAMVTVVARSGCGRGCRCGFGSLGRDGLRCLVNADDTAGFGSCEVEGRFRFCRWHSFAAHHLRAHHTVVLRLLVEVGWVSVATVITVEVTEAASTAGAARTATERTVCAGADLSKHVIRRGGRRSRSRIRSHLESQGNGQRAAQERVVTR